MSQQPVMDRRAFLYGTSLAGFGIFCQGRNGRAAGVGPNDVIQVAGIGVGGKGSSDIDHAGNHGKVVAICDVSDKTLKSKAEKFKEAKTFHDFRELLATMGDKIDAVTVSTADHAHAQASVAAMRLGKHVYCQKPLTHTVWEARLMRETAKKYGVCTQMGNQGGATEGLRQSVEILQAGVLGDVTDVHVWTDRPSKYWKQAPDITARPQGSFEPPTGLHWDLFLAGAPERPFAPVYTPMLWRGWWDFGTGVMGDMGCHNTNVPFHGLDLGLPVRVSAKSGEINPETFPAWATVVYEFPARGKRPPVKLTWYEGAKDGKPNRPSSDLFPEGYKMEDNGWLCIGSNGTMCSARGESVGRQLWPVEKFKDFKAPEPFIPRIQGAGANNDDNHKLEWFQAIRAGKPEMPFSNFAFAAVQTEALLVGNIAMRTGEAVDYDGVSGRITNSSAAQELVKGTYRKGWEL
ncbi:Gfo/Idh/MocA family protein [Paludisphaera rhizosphaerae]|uniref:Gfo/Idh/MocA family protein n=1 Tax=Paludisphaera rhizosphaerae TaxID=2711216 RepID=UPI00197D8FA4|nr:Gfo/Idh/MocA family oxidoreductase [Paludisphaera rhizosphaerae]